MSQIRVCMWQVMKIEASFTNPTLCTNNADDFNMWIALAELDNNCIWINGNSREATIIPHNTYDQRSGSRTHTQYISLQYRHTDIAVTLLEQGPEKHAMSWITNFAMSRNANCTIRNEIGYNACNKTCEVIAVQCTLYRHFLMTER